MAHVSVDRVPCRFVAAYLPLSALLQYRGRGAPSTIEIRDLRALPLGALSASDPESGGTISMEFRNEHHF